MRSIFKILLLTMLLMNVTYANEYSSVQVVKLKKDAHKKFLVQYGPIKKIFKFRWTLYINGGLVVLRSYDRIVAQNVLYQKLKNSTFRIDLQPKSDYTSAYLLVKFLEFDYETGEAIFKVFLSDKKSQISLMNLDE